MRFAIQRSCSKIDRSFEDFDRSSVGALPQTPAGTLSLHPARGNRPLTLSFCPLLERFSPACPACACPACGAASHAIRSPQWARKPDIMKTQLSLLPERVAGTGTLRSLCGGCILFFSFGGAHIGFVGALPQTPAGALPLHPARGNRPLTLSFCPYLSAFPLLVPRAALFSASRFFPFPLFPYWNRDMISCGESPPTIDSPGLINWSNSAFFRCPSATTCSSIEACVTSRMTSTFRVCPMRYARSVA